MLSRPKKNDEVLVDEAAQRLAEILVAQWEYQADRGSDVPAANQPPLFLPLDS